MIAVCVLAVTFVVGGIGVAAIAYLLLAIYFTASYPVVSCPHSRNAERFQPAVTILKPLCGTEPRLYECLRSFCVQDYAEMQIVFGLADEFDPARLVVERLIAEFPERDLTLVIDGASSAANPKVGNLINMMRAAKHQMVAVSDSDVLVGPDCLSSVVNELADPDIGAVTSLYRARAERNLASQLGALYIHDWFIPSTFVDAGMRGVDFCFGPLSVMRKRALDAIGGFEALANYLADDFMMGKLIAAAGYRVTLSTHPVYTIVAEPDIASLIRHEVRWGRTVHSAQPLDHAMTLVTLALPLPILGFLINPSPVMGALILGIGGLRLIQHELTRLKLDLERDGSAWMLPLREFLCFGIWAMSLTGRTVSWRDRHYSVARGGELVAAQV
jgi:ceramide glucosyltransferase